IRDRNVTGVQTCALPIVKRSLCCLHHQFVHSHLILEEWYPYTPSLNKYSLESDHQYKLESVASDCSSCPTFELKQTKRPVQKIVESFVRVKIKLNSFDVP